MRPVVWYWRDRTTGQIVKLLIRATPTHQLTYVIARLNKYENLMNVNGNNIETILELIRELRRRSADGQFTPSMYTLAKMNQYDPPACACGRPGTRIVGVTTYCDACVTASEPKRRRLAAMRENRSAAMERDIREAERAELSSRAHHLATGRPRRGFK